MKIIIKLSLILTIFSCSQKDGPEQVLTSFVNYRFSKNQKREYLLKMTSGSFNQSIAAMSNEEFRIFSTPPIKKKKFKILNSQCDELKCSISYFIKYQSFKNNENISSVELKKVASLKNVESGWKISDVANIKEFHNTTMSIDVIGN